MHDLGVIHGRFQVLHNDHLKYLLAGKERCKHLVVGITNPDPRATAEDKADPNRASLTANPLTWYQRMVIIRETLLAQGLLAAEFTLAPFPINLPELIPCYLPMDGVFFLTIYDQWGEKKLALFKSLGLKTEVMWRRPIEEKGVSSTRVRKLMASGEPWEHLVPKAACRVMNEMDVPGIVRSLHKKNRY
ncbi:nicotinate-nucleotide adenylyltransferase [Dethiosulfatarculus sandiegensis]|uniref:Nicotinamide mononucleotide adenylyltransferase n=1 Tax=Dethiosulfatarculus sandiegensis TaxID=1429043 RepID=A0A0D2JYH8_9BACT|nr:nicotinate-nucleotide adenylyltransferase [Dethiosulfatarculus sandiegensis]KIX14585.1 nicotinamide mononucleotide adenylyltransferase [Dethiosulfatarculus sandiegensis]